MEDIVEVRIDYEDFKRKHPFPWHCRKRFIRKNGIKEFRGIIVWDVNNKYVGKVSTVSVACSIEEMTKELASSKL